MIKIPNIKKTYNSKIVLNTDEFVVYKNNIYIIIGDNGCGKSTFSKLLSGIIMDDNNKKYLIYDDCGNKLNIGYMPQKSYIFDMTLENNILLSTNDKNKCNQLINEFGLDYLRKKNAKKFSGGEQQKLALARFMMKDYDIAILDEPTSAMDKISTKNSEYIIKKYSTNKVLFVITHSIEQAKRLSKIIYKIENGNIKLWNC